LNRIFPTVRFCSTVGFLYFETFSKCFSTDCGKACFSIGTLCISNVKVCSRPGCTLYTLIAFLTLYALQASLACIAFGSADTYRVRNKLII
jgi:hypothetical protein